ncbi:MAG: hypothetical protein OXH75_07090 [Acidobacteria bacterium]|nr:hypothetical protein [Acidobacteriota bacterium]
MVRWLVLTGGAVLLLYGAFLLLTQLGNRSVTRELRALPQGERADRVMLLTLPSGRSIPVNYLREGDVVYAGADGRWWRELRGDGAPVALEIRGEALGGHARAIENDPARTHDVFARLRPTVPSWLPDWLNGVLVEIRLDVESTAGERERVDPRA